MDSEASQPLPVEENPAANVDATTNGSKDEGIEINHMEDLNNHQDVNGGQPEPISDATNVGNLVPDEDGNPTKELEIEVNIQDESVMGDDPSLYDDVMGSGLPKIDSRDVGGESAEIDDKSLSGISRLGTPGGSVVPSTGSNPASGMSKRVCCYVGNLTWWTNDKDLSDAISALQVTDLIDIKFYENKVNGQSKGFALVTVGSDASFRTLMDKLPRSKIHGQDPVVTHFNRHFLAQFEEQARKDFPSSAGNSASDHHQQGFGAGNQQQFFMNQRNRNYGPPGSNGPHTGTGLPLSRPMGPNGAPMMMGPRATGQVNSYNQMMPNGGGPGLVGPYPGQPRMGPPQQPQQQSLLGNTPTGMMPIRPGMAPAQGGYVGGARTGNGMMMQSQQSQPQQGGLLGNRPGMMPGSGPGVASTNQGIPGSQTGLLPMRPGMAPIGPPSNMTQSPGLLSNPPGMQPRMGVPGQQPAANTWDRSGQVVNGGAGVMNPATGMMQPMSAAQRSPVGPISQPGAMTQQVPGQYMAANQYGGVPGQQNPAMAMNGMMPNQQPHPHQLYHQAQGIPGQTGPYGAQTGYPTNPHQAIHLQQAHHQMMPDNSYGGATTAGQHYHRQASAGTASMSGGSGSVKMSEIEFQEALEKNRIISGQAISRAVQDAAIGNYASAIETLVTAISLIKQSKIGYDERCKIFAASLEDTKQGIEDKYYGSLNMMQLTQQQQQQRMYSSNVLHEETSERSRGRYERSRSRSRSRDSRDRDRDRGGDRESSKEHRSHHRRDKHHRSSHRDRDRDRRSRSRDRRVVSNDRDDSYYEESGNKYHRSSRH